MPDAGHRDQPLSRHGPQRPQHRDAGAARGRLLSLPARLPIADLAVPGPAIPDSGGWAARIRARLDRAAALSAAPPGPLAVALSGGGDSMALLHLAADWARDSGHDLLALIVDHGLRPGSDADAARAAARAEALGVPARILRWDGPKPATGLQQAARRARLRLLAEACMESGTHALLLAHTRDDQAETVWLRLEAGSSWRGLAAMRPAAPFPLWPPPSPDPDSLPLLLVRPLLDVSRADLRSFLTDRDADWIEDPANTDPRFARIRARAALARLGAQAADRLTHIARHARILAEAEDSLARALMETALAAPEDGTLRLARAALTGPGAARLFRAALTAASGAEREPAPEAARAALARLRTGESVTLGGAAASIHGETVLIRRDPGALLGRAGVPPAPPLALPPSRTIVWDGRFAVRTDAPGLTVGALGDDRSAPEDRDPAHLSTPDPARATLPALRDAAGRRAAPSLARMIPLAAWRLRTLLFAAPSWFDGDGNGE